jgi:hypothetical protein
MRAWQAGQGPPTAKNAWSSARNATHCSALRLAMNNESGRSWFATIPRQSLSRTKLVGSSRFLPNHGRTLYSSSVSDHKPVLDPRPAITLRRAPPVSMERRKGETASPLPRFSPALVLPGCTDWLANQQLLRRVLPRNEFLRTAMMHLRRIEVAVLVHAELVYSVQSARPVER